MRAGGGLSLSEGGPCTLHRTPPPSLVRACTPPALCLRAAIPLILCFLLGSLPFISSQWSWEAGNVVTLFYAQAHGCSATSTCLSRVTQQQSAEARPKPRPVCSSRQHLSCLLPRQEGLTDHSACRGRTVPGARVCVPAHTTQPGWDAPQWESAGRESAWPAGMSPDGDTLACLLPESRTGCQADRGLGPSYLCEA